MGDVAPKPLKTPNGIDPFLIVCSSSAAIAARICTHPLDTIRIKVQTYTGSVVPPYRELIPKPRLKALYSGLGISLGLGVPALSVYLVSYEASKRYLGAAFLPTDRTPTLLEQMPVFAASGFLAEIASGVLYTPNDVLKSRLQKGNDPDVGNSAMRMFSKIVREEGYRGIFRGYLMGMAVYVPYCAAFWTGYEVLKSNFIPNYNAMSTTSPLPTSSAPSLLPFEIPLTAKYTLCSVTSCVLSATLTTPIELVQSRWQTSAGLIKGGIREIVGDIWRRNGVRGFYRGLGVRVVYAIPANSISMTVFESLKRWKGI